jgi:aspartate ammonia-lyase
VNKTSAFCGTNLPLGGTAIGTGFGAPAGYRASVYAHLSNITQVEFKAPSNAFDAKENMDVFLRMKLERECHVCYAGSI